VPDRAANGKMLNRPKGMNAVSTEVVLQSFSSSLLFYHRMPRLYPRLLSLFHLLYGCFGTLVPMFFRRRLGDLLELPKLFN